jgi:(p)ppGpp synthase/HD superfamily hydrolase
VEQVGEAMKFDNLDDFLSLVGFGDITRRNWPGPSLPAAGRQSALGCSICNLLNPPGGQKGLTVRGVGGVHTRLAQCCTPWLRSRSSATSPATRASPFTPRTVPGGGITERERLIDVEWGVEEAAHPVPVVITAEPRDG